MSSESLREYVSASELVDWHRDSVERLIGVIEDLTDQQRVGVYHRLVNPPLWEVTHALWFIEHWVLRRVRDREPYFEGIDDVYNSINIRHGRRWDVELIPFDEVREFADYLIETVATDVNSHYDDDLFLYRLVYAVYHADMHTEAETFQRQGRGLPAPTWVSDGDPTDASDFDESLLNQDVTVEGGTYPLGSAQTEPFVFDNEKWGHPVEVDEFDIAVTPVTQGQFREFVEAGGYSNRAYWSAESWEWIQLMGVESPRFWKHRNGDWKRRQFDRWLSLIHI